MAEFYERLVCERARLGLKPKEMADLCGVSDDSQRLYEKGIRFPDAKYLERIASAGADVLYILTGARSLPSKQSLSPREAAVLDNYRNCAEGDQAAVERLASLAAKSNQVREIKEKAG